MAKVFDQTTITLVWDFDKTLIPAYMQKPLFETYGIDEKTFWDEVNQLADLYKKEDINVNPETVYLNHLLTYVQEGILEGLNNEKLREMGRKIKFFRGLPEFFEKSKKLIEDSDVCRNFGIEVEHYVVSTGLTEIIKGSAIYPYIQGVWGCEFIERPYTPVDGQLRQKETGRQISSIAYSLDNTTKTRALFEINKGVNIHPGEISVNQTMAEDERRVPFENMIYIADGPSDIPAFSVVKKNGGKTLAVYQLDQSRKSFRQAKTLMENGRVDMFSEANYEEDSQTYLYLTSQLTEIADRIIASKKEALQRAKQGVPGHWVE